MNGNNDIWREGVIHAYNSKDLNSEYVYAYFSVNIGREQTP